MLWIPGHAVLSTIGFLLGAGIFGVSVWVVLRKESSPFEAGIWIGLAKCAVFQVVMAILMAIPGRDAGFLGDRPGCDRFPARDEQGLWGRFR